MERQPYKQTDRQTDKRQALHKHSGGGDSLLANGIRIQTEIIFSCKAATFSINLTGWLCNTVVERRSLASEPSLFCD